jgi:hypothetical protein
LFVQANTQLSISKSSPFILKPTRGDSEIIKASLEFGFALAAESHLNLRISAQHTCFYLNAQLGTSEKFPEIANASLKSSLALVAEFNLTIGIQCGFMQLNVHLSISAESRLTLIPTEGNSGPAIPAVFFELSWDSGLKATPKQSALYQPKDGFTPLQWKKEAISCLATQTPSQPPDSLIRTRPLREDVNLPRLTFHKSYDVVAFSVSNGAGPASPKS